MTIQKRNDTNEYKRLIKSNLRYNEYYDLQYTFDKLYQDATEGKTFQHLYEIITSKENILLAYRNIKRNTGSLTQGINGRNIEDWEKVGTDIYINYIGKRLEDYHPSPVRRKFILKGDGKERPLGIPTIEDRLIQQCIKQVLEPICEAKFHPNSYGFRPNRNTANAICAFQNRINLGKNYFIVDIDIKGFFDNINHNKLIRQLWTLGIHDKKVISIIKEMLTAPIFEENNVSVKGVPQGGILSPLLANVVLNELDWWISNQWETFKPYKQVITFHRKASGKQDKSNIYRILRKTGLKEMYIVRYADDFKIICKNKDHAIRTFAAVKLWLNERLGLDINEDKSQLIDIRKGCSEFLGFRLKAVKKGKRKGQTKWVIKSNVKDKAKNKVVDSIKTQVAKVHKYRTELNIRRLNAIIAGQQNYYQIATHVSEDFSNINYKLSRYLCNRLGKPSHINESSIITREHRQRYKNNYKIHHVNKMGIYPIADIKHKNPMGFNRIINNYTTEGRKYIHENINHVDVFILNYLMLNPVQSQSIEFNDNRISLYSAQKGKCVVSGEILNLDMETHHIKGRSGKHPDKYNNLALVTYDVHKLIHATDEFTINKYLDVVKLDKDGIRKLNKFRTDIGNFEINI